MTACEDEGMAIESILNVKGCHNVSQEVYDAVVVLNHEVAALKQKIALARAALREDSR